MKQLLIVANPRRESFSFQIVQKYKTLSESQGNEVTILDLYRTDLKQDFLSFQDMSQMAENPITKKLQSLITEHQELVFVFPIWWGDAPAILKNFIDCNFTAGFAFEYQSGGKKKGLLWGKTARIFATSGAPSMFYKFILHIQWLWNVNRIGFCGIKLKSFDVFGDMNRSDASKEKYLNLLEKRL